ncbi:type II toxin-antitoxin system VapC family toxin [Archaeoglobus veneficus]|uniref:PilT protein domain protein n=1 Tax=Archaeoglobus veneficus (strain DSM 11195 / SNP6) TaxID=693661 RepID=F2KRF8_ARCVS|nr:PIN domain-containing protein [Archaeoglobus veneficus]AEA47892.1 PilT protein domain protein [Archaeoglobus veneficus SNP6]
MIDTNVFIAAVKKGWTKTTDLVLHLLANPDFEIVANDVLIAEYEKYAKGLNAEEFLEFIKLRIVILNPSEDEIEKCEPYFPENEAADIVHAATCLKAKAVLITNDRHFDKIKETGLIEVWSISKAITKILGN